MELTWDPTDPLGPGPCIKVHLANSADVMAMGIADGLSYPKPALLTALIDTGASVTVISKKYAEHCKLFTTSPGSELTALGNTIKCGEHAGSINFPDTTLKSFESMRIISAVFVGERHYACLIGRDILQHWKITFDGRSKKVLIEDRR